MNRGNVLRNNRLTKVGSVAIYLGRHSRKLLLMCGLWACFERLLVVCGPALRDCMRLQMIRCRVGR